MKVLVDIVLGVARLTITIVACGMSVVLISMFLGLDGYKEDRVLQKVSGPIGTVRGESPADLPYRQPFKRRSEEDRREDLEVGGDSVR